MAEPIDVVRAFCDGWGPPDQIAATLVHLADDCVHHNIPLEPGHGIPCAPWRSWSGLGVVATAGARGGGDHRDD